MMLSQARQRRAYARKRRRKLEPFPCRCGRLVNGQPCMITDARTRSRMWRTQACEQWARRARKAQRRARGLPAHDSAPYPPRWRPGEFEQAWPALLAEDDARQAAMAAALPAPAMAAGL